MNLGKMMQEAQRMQREMANAKKQFEEKIFEFTYQSDAIKITMSGKLKILDLLIDQKSFDSNDFEMLQDSIIVSINQSIEKIVKDKEEAMKKYSAMNI